MKYKGFLFILMMATSVVSFGGVSSEALAQGDTPLAAPSAKNVRKANRALSRKVYAALAQHKEIDAGTISVVARNGAITLDGSVKAANEIDTVAAVAKTVPGVTSVTNRLSVQRPMGE
ncbi:BON domain-containing protein [Paraburkholderia sp. J67]|uniref:BON domain-containing protein n=1 Tax=Paraburkholderia sp. J67 TaxID=2805435 RepID=UPI002ABE6EB7|nr:BON domain-containing protein [Paraburkholderia sp. J67]